MLNNSIITKAQLANESFANMNLRAIAKREVLLGNFIVYGDRIQCLQKAQFMLNSHLLKCETLESFSLPEGYTVEYGGQKMEHHVTTRQGQLLNIQWLEDYQTPLNEEEFEIDVDTRAEYHPVVEAIFLDSVGEFSIAKISIFSGGTCLLIFLSFILCFCCCRGCRDCVILVCSKSCTALYNLFTTKACRLKRDNDRLRKDNRQKRKILERNLREHDLIDQALSKLEMSIACTCNQDLEGGRTDQPGFQRAEQASSSFLDAKAGAVMKDKETFL